MRGLALNRFVSLDGVMQAPGGPHEDPTGGFAHGGWAVNYFDEQMIEKMAEAGPYELLLGRGTYEIFAAHWPMTRARSPTTSTAPAKRVASTTLDRVEWNNSTLIAGDLADYVKARKREHGPEIQVHGSPGLTQILLEHDLIDEFRIWSFPVVLGTGKRLFGDGHDPNGTTARRQLSFQDGSDDQHVCPHGRDRDRGDGLRAADRGRTRTAPTPRRNVTGGERRRGCRGPRNGKQVPGHDHRQAVLLASRSHHKSWQARSERPRSPHEARCRRRVQDARAATGARRPATLLETKRSHASTEYPRGHEGKAGVCDREVTRDSPQRGRSTIDDAQLLGLETRAAHGTRRGEHCDDTTNAGRRRARPP